MFFSWILRWLLFFNLSRTWGRKFIWNAWIEDSSPPPPPPLPPLPSPPTTTTTKLTEFSLFLQSPSPATGSRDSALNPTTTQTAFLGSQSSLYSNAAYPISMAHQHQPQHSVLQFPPLWWRRGNHAFTISFFLPGSFFSLLWLHVT